MMEEAPGSEVVANRLAEVLFIQTLRAHIASGSESCKRGWLRAIFDPQIGAALRSVHENVKPLDRPVAGRRCGYVAVGVCFALQRAAGANTARLRNGLADAEGDSIAKPAG